MSTNLCYSLAKGPIKIKCYWSVLMAEWLRRVLCQVAAASLFWFQMWSFDACCAPIRANVCLCIILYNKGKKFHTHRKKNLSKAKKINATAMWSGWLKVQTLDPLMDVKSTYPIYFLWRAKDLTVWCMIDRLRWVDRPFAVSKFS